MILGRVLGGGAFPFVRLGDRMQPVIQSREMGIHTALNHPANSTTKNNRVLDCPLFTFKPYHNYNS